MNPAAPDGVGHCCALQYCRQPEIKISPGSPICRWCKGFLHGFMCSSIPEPVEVNGLPRLECLLCNNTKPSANPLPQTHDKSDKSPTHTAATQTNISLASIQQIQDAVSKLNCQPWSSVVLMNGHLCIEHQDAPPPPGDELYSNEVDIIFAQ